MNKEYKNTSIEDYLKNLDNERQVCIQNLQKTILENLPKGFEEGMSYGMIGYYVPHSIYPKGYHCKPEQPLPFMNIASQKNFIAIYHMGIYANPELMNWFKTEYSKYSSAKLDIGKSCIRFKKMDQIPYELIGELASKITVNEWIESYEKAFLKTN